MILFYDYSFIIPLSTDMASKTSEVIAPLYFHYFQEPISEHPFADLWCFYVTEIKDSLTVIVGNGCFLTFCSAVSLTTLFYTIGTVRLS